MARAGVVDSDEGAPARPARSTASSSAQKLLSLEVTSRTTWRLGIARPRPVGNATILSRGYLALKMKHQHQTMQMRTAAPDDPRPGVDQPLAVWRLPPLAPIARGFSLQHQILNDDVLKAPVARARRGREQKSFRAVDRKLEDPGPRRRFDVSSSSRLAPPSGRTFAFSAPEGWCGGKCFSRAISSLSVWFSA